MYVWLPQVARWVTLRFRAFNEQHLTRVEAYTIRLVDGVKRAVRSRLLWLSSVLLFVLGWFVYGSLASVYQDEGFVGVAGVMAVQIRRSATTISEWLLPSTPIEVAGYLPAYILFFITARAIARAWKPALTIRPFQTGSTESNFEISGVSLANLLRDELVKIARNTTVAMSERRFYVRQLRGSSTAYLPSSSRTPEVVVQLLDVADLRPAPAFRLSGIGPRAVEDLFRYLLGSETMITGDFFPLNPPHYRLLSRTEAYGQWVSDVEVGSNHEALPRAVQRLAEQVLADLEPLLYTLWLLTDGQADQALDFILSRPPPKDSSQMKSWASVLELAAALAYLAHTARETRPTAESLERAITHLSTSYVLKNAMALHLLREGSKEEALDVARQAIKLAPARRAPWMTAAQVLSALGREKKALRRLFLTLKLPGENDAVVLSELGLTLIRSGRRSEAQAYLELAVKLEPDNALHRTRLALTKESSIEARRLNEEAISVDPQNPVGYSSLGMQLADHGELEEALPYLRKAVELDPLDGDKRFWLHLALKELGREKDAEIQLAKARQLGSELPGSNIHYSRREWT